MNTYLLPIREFDFLSAFLQESIVVSQDIHLNPSDKIVFLISDFIAGSAEINSIIESQGNLKIILNFQYAFLEENRINRFEPFFNNLLSFSIASQFILLTQEQELIIFSSLKSHEDDLGFLLTNIESIWEEEKERNEILKRQQAKSQNPFVYKRFNYEELNPHQQSQFFLNEIASICNVHSWTATNDKNKIHNDVRLGQFDIDSFPLLKTGRENLQIMELIDTIWIKNNRPICAFETETSTSIYSGILRMSDMSTIISNSNFSMYIVAPKERSKKFLKEINRPTFKRLNLDKHCRFIPLESLKSLYEKIIGLDGYVDYHIIDMISQTPNQLEQILH